MNLRTLMLPAVCLALLFTQTAQAAQWPSLPAACLPDRANKWDEASGAESFQASCHCPPTSMCPSTYEEYSNAALSPLPMSLVAKCCPVIEPPTPPVPPSPPPPPVSCAPKYYPSLTESGLAGADINFVGNYNYQDGTSHRFGLSYQGAYTGPNYVSQLPTRYNYSLRTGNFNGSMGGGGATGWTWVLAGYSCDMANCPPKKFYAPATDGFNNGNPNLRSIISRFGASNLTWFSFSAAKTSYLADNLMTSDMLAAWGSVDRYIIGTPEVQYTGGIKSNMFAQITYTYTPTTLDSRIESGAAGFLTQCRDAGGQYVELETKPEGAGTCSYLQCRYVYEGSTAMSCLSADTKVTLADGSTKLVPELKLGDVVKGSTGDHKITASNIYQSGLRVLYGINGSGALLTGDHPVHTTQGWKVVNPDAAKLYADKPGFAKTALAPGDVLVTDKGEVKVTSIKRFPKVDPIATYNIRVEGNAGFYANGIEVKGFSKMEMIYE